MKFKLILLVSKQDNNILNQPYQESHQKTQYNLYILLL